MTAEEECVEQYRKALNNPKAKDVVNDLRLMLEAAQNYAKLRGTTTFEAAATLRMLCS